MKIGDLIKKIEKDYPVESAYDFDNTGANVVEYDDEITNILLCLDCDMGAIEKAKENNCNLIISHHPLIFHSLKRLNDDIVSKRIKTLIKNGMSSYAIHTNFDVNIKMGMGQVVLNRIFKKGEIKKSDFLEKLSINKVNYALGNIIILDKEMVFEKMVERVKTTMELSDEKISFYKVKDKIKKIVIIPGSGAGDVDKVIKEKPDVFITSDLKYNNILDLYENGISYINATHYGMEKYFVEYMNKYLNAKIKTKIINYYNVNQ